MATQARRPGAVLLVGAFVAVAVLVRGAGGAVPAVAAEQRRCRTFEIPTFAAAGHHQHADRRSETALDEVRMPMAAQRWIYLVVLAVARRAARRRGGRRWSGGSAAMRERRAPYELDAATRTSS